MRSGKRSGGGPNLVSWNPVQSEGVDGSDYEDPRDDMERADSLRSISSMGVERADLGIGIQPLSSLVLRRVSRQSPSSSGGRGSWGGGHMLRTGRVGGEALGARGGEARLVDDGEVAGMVREGR